MADKQHNTPNPSDDMPPLAARRLSLDDECRAIGRLEDAHAALNAALQWAKGMDDLDCVMMGTLRASEVTMAQGLVALRAARRHLGREMPQ